ncbi:unnamed protein product [Paramecium pentaurelia]|uniref:DNA-directed RNA polymerase subunit beta n=1 Tax=Paramecium pentaurelia TaxID=43138 RepID=A0A8S1YKJ2_9CILI|nr:unnamed protein product [Paramecium pentaurelia]
MEIQQGDQLRVAAKHHIESFNYLYTHGLVEICRHLSPVEICVPGNRDIRLPFKNMKIWIEELQIGMPTQQGMLGDNRVLPTQCRQMKKSYTAPMLATICREIDDNPKETVRLSLGEIPILVKSQKCHLNGLSAEELVQQQEDCNEFGGYFIINGNEKIIRMLIIQKRNYPIAFKRPGYKNKGFNFSPYAVQMKCVRSDQYARTITLHYLMDGNVYLRIILKKKELQMPVIILLRALTDMNDYQIYQQIVRSQAEKSDISDRVEVMIADAKSRGINSQKDALEYIGRLLRVELNIFNPETTDLQVGRIFLREHICVHLENDQDKASILLLCIEKLYALFIDEINPDNLDSLVNQEVLLSGHLYTAYLREKLEDLLVGVREKILKDATKEQSKLKDLAYFKRCFDLQTTVGEKLENFLATGNLRSQTGLDLMEASGFTIIADKLNNMRFLSHFRSVHRGSYFAQMKTTTVRKLLPDVWGFVCPVHTPDGGPCGLLNHITMSCVPLTHPDEQDIEELLFPLGVQSQRLIYSKNDLPVVLNGKLIGYLNSQLLPTFEHTLRVYKSNGTIKETTEVACLPRQDNKSPLFPGVYINTTVARLMRPVINLKLNTIEWISPLEQINMSIACTQADIRTDTQYQEIDPAYILSILASNVPFLNYNQSPRNMYQCQMAKQTMGSPCHNYPYRFDNKMYRILFPQKPVVRCFGYDDYQFADYASGTNAIVAVISYTGYDMEDAMILCKSSYERGFGHGIIYKSTEYSLNDDKEVKYKLLSQIPIQLYNQIKSQIPVSLLPYGLPEQSQVITKGTAVLALYDSQLQQVKVHHSKDSETSRIEQVAVVNKSENDVSVMIKYRINRNPIIGDKFSSRHGQKGVMSLLWPQIDMPFSESGMVPDIIINPHAFPSRMTIGMLIESMAAKANVLQGEMFETHPFQNYENDNVVDYFGKQLIKHGYNYYGNETLYSGIYGTPLKVDIYFGVVYYQRLRHMVSDKSQARSMGPVDVLTQQPIKGRKKGGGIRLGEMERDALIAHGVAYCINDRLLKCSDYSETYICDNCGNMLATYQFVQLLSLENIQSVQSSHPYCVRCKKSKCSKVAIPFVLRYLVNELAAMNVKLEFSVVR